MMKSFGNVSGGGGVKYFSHGENNRKGVVTVLVKQSLKIDLENVNIDPTDTVDTVLPR